MEVKYNFLFFTLRRDRARLLKSYEMCLCLGEGETVMPVLSVQCNWSGTVKHLLLTHLSPLFFLFYYLLFCSSPYNTCFFSLSTRDTSIREFYFILLPHFLCFPAYHTAFSMCLVRIMLLYLCLFFVHISFVIPHL